jgi:hypothetical protein
LKLETDAGTQTRTFRFRPSEDAGGGWQGVSTASWDSSRPPINNSFGGLDFGFQPPAPPGGSLRVVTTRIRPGYLRKNGVPYSGGATMTEYFDRFDVPGGDVLLVDIAEVVDPEYLAQPFWTSTHFKKQNDAAGWNPTPCDCGVARRIDLVPWYSSIIGSLTVAGGALASTSNASRPCP